MSDLSAFQQIQSILEVIPESGIHFPDMPVEIAANEAEVVVTAAREDLAAFTEVGFDPSLVDSLAESVAALRYAHAHYIANIGEMKKAAKEWRKQKPVVMSLRRKLIAAWTLATRNVGEATLTLQRIRQGRSRIQMIQNLMALAEMGQQYPEAREAIHLDVKELQQARALGLELWSIEAKATTEPRSSKSKQWRDRAFTHMRSILKTVVLTAEYAHLDRPDRLALYHSAYRRRIQVRYALKKAP